MPTTAYVIHLDDEKAEAVNRLAARSDLTPEDVIRQAVESWVEFDEEDVRAIEEGIADHEAGRTVSHEAVTRWLESWGTGNELPPPKCGD